MTDGACLFMPSRMVYDAEYVMNPGCLFRRPSFALANGVLLMDWLYNG